MISDKNLQKKTVHFLLGGFLTLVALFLSLGMSRIAHLKSGQMKEAKVYLEQTNNSSDKETTYLKGLYHYRNGSAEKANEIWKPLIIIPTENLRAHHLKQEMMKYYYEGTPYHKAN